MNKKIVRLLATPILLLGLLPTGAVAQQAVTSLTLINADTDLDIGPLVNGSTINFAITGSSLNVRANTSPATVGSVRFALDGNATFRTETAAPYALGGDNPTGNYTPWTPGLGAHTVTATPYTGAAAVGTAGTPLTITFTVINQPVAGNPTANAGQDKSVVLPASTTTLSGSGSDPDGTITGYAWTQVSGPNTATRTGAATATLGLSGLIQGTYVFRLTVTDNDGKTAADEASVFVVPSGGGGATLSGELKKWHRVTLSFQGPATSESATPNPFTDYRLNVLFSHAASGKSYLVPGFYAADGDAANTSATAGNVWRVRFAPDETGVWTYSASFRAGSGVATSEDPVAGVSGGFFDGASGSFTIAPSDKTGRDLRRKGRLQYVGKHHLRFAETGEYFLKEGSDAPENLLGYADFDGDFKTDGHKDNLIKTWTAHIPDWQAGDPTWQGSKGKGLVGAINYLASEELNAFSFLTLNIDGDDQNVFPYTTYGERLRMDVSRLEQWEILFAHGEAKGMYLHFKTQETENEMLLDNGDTGPQRKLYYRELIARYGHHLALNWNLGEENGALGAVNQNTAQRKAMAQYFFDHDPYHHHIVIHNGKAPTDLLGTASKLTGYSLQTNLADFTDVFASVKSWVDQSAAAGVPWVVACDEPGDASHALRPDNDAGNSHIDGRKNALWGQIMAGGAGSEFYFGYSHAQSDLTCEDFRSRDAFWDYCRYALQFFYGQNVPFQDMSNRNSLVSGNGNNANRCLGKIGDTYIVQLPSGGTHALNLAGVTGTFTVKWFNPRSGGALIAGPTVTAGGVVSLGAPPNTTTEDWIALVQIQGGGGGTNAAPVCNAGPDKAAILAGASIQVTLNGTTTDDGLPAGSTLTRSWIQLSGPAGATFSSTVSATTTVTFAAAGSYVFRLSASDGALSGSDEVTVTVSPPSSGGTFTFGPIHDVFTQNGANNNVDVLRVENAATRTRIIYLQFDLGSLVGTPSEAKLRLTEGDDVSGGTMTLRLYAAASNNWTESAITGATAPVRGVPLSSFTGNIVDAQVVEFNVAGRVTGPGIYSFILEADSSTLDVSFASKENATVAARPELVVTVPDNTFPTFGGYAFRTRVNESRTIPYGAILASAIDTDGDSLSFVPDPGLSSAQGGAVAMGATNLIYTPAIDHVGADSFQLTVTDGRGGTAPGTVAVEVLVDHSFETAVPMIESAAGSGWTIRFTGNAGLPYALERSLDLAAWTPVLAGVADAQGGIAFVDPPLSEPRVFYRIAAP